MDVPKLEIQIRDEFLVHAAFSASASSARWPVLPAPSPPSRDAHPSSLSSRSRHVLPQPLACTTTTRTPFQRAGARSGVQLSTHAFGSPPTPQQLLRRLRRRVCRSASAGSGSCGDGAGEGRGNWCAHSPPNTPCAAQAQPFPVFVSKGPSRAPPPPLAPPLPLTSRPAALVVSFSARAEATHVPLHAAQHRAAHGVATRSLPATPCCWRRPCPLKRADLDPSLTGGAGVSPSRTPMFETVNGLAVLLGVSAPRAQFLLISKGERAPSFVNLR